MYGGVDLVEYDYEDDFFLVHRDNGDIQKYSISEESKFVNWIESHGDDIDRILLTKRDIDYENAQEKEFNRDYEDQENQDREFNQDYEDQENQK